MNKFYKHWQFWLYLLIIIANVYDIAIRNSFNFLKWHSWMSMALIIIFSYYIYIEIKEK